MRYSRKLLKFTHYLRFQPPFLGLNDFVEQFKMENVVIHKQLYKGLPTKLIPEFVKKNHIDLVVMGTVCRVGIPGFIIGNTAEEILRKIRCSVLTMKPEGFVSPVQ